MMHETLKRFFSPIPRDLQIAEGEYVKVDVCVAMANAMARSTNSSLYMVDYQRKEFLYVSPNPLFLCGYSPEQVREKGYGFFLERVLPEDLERIYEINEAGFRFYYDQPVDKRRFFSIGYDFHIRASDDHRLLLHHEYTPVLLNDKGDIWLSLCTVSLSPFKEAGEVVIWDHTASGRYTYSFAGKRWKKSSDIVLTDREKAILQLSVKGLSNTEIGECLFIDASTVKYHKRRLFDKLNARHIGEAVGKATCMRLI